MQSSIATWLDILTSAVIGAVAAFLLVRFRKKIEVVRERQSFRREFTAHVTHELRTPVTAILGAVEMLDDGSSLSENERRELFDIIREQAGRLKALSGDVLSLAQLDRLQQHDERSFEPVDLRALQDRVLELESAKAKSMGIDLVKTYADIAEIQGDAQLLEQAWINLVENAFRYSGSKVVELGCRVKNSQVILSVTDYGVGIPAQHIPRLFERFYRVDKNRSRSLGGTGLGLAIVKHVAQLHGGDVGVSSDPGVRTSFRITFAA